MEPPPNPYTPPPPPPGDDAVLPMTLPAAAGWVAAIHFVFLLVAVLLVSAREEMQHDMVAHIACQVAAYGVGVFLLLRVHGANSRIRDFLGARHSHWGVYPLAILIGATATVPTTLLMALIEKRWPIEEGPNSFTNLFFAAAPAQQAMIAIGVIALGPLVEETLFRGAVFVPLRKSNSVVRVILVTAALFAVVHLVPQRMLPLFMMGALMGYLRASSGTLWASVLAHAAFNGVEMAQLWVYGPEIADVEIGNEVLLAATAAFGLGLLGYSYLVRSPAVLAAREADR